MADTVRVKVNADRVSYLVPNPISNQPPLPRAADYGEVVEMTAEEAERLRGITVRRFYTDPATGVANALYRNEPAVLDADAKEEEAAARRSEIDARLAELDAERNDLLSRRPPAAVAVAPTGAAPVVLSPATTGARLLPGPDGPRDAAEATQAGMPAPLNLDAGTTTTTDEGDVKPKPRSKS